MPVPFSRFRVINGTQRAYNVDATLTEGGGAVHAVPPTPVPANSTVVIPTPPATNVTRINAGSDPGGGRKQGTVSAPGPTHFEEAVLTIDPSPGPADTQLLAAFTDRTPPPNAATDLMI